MPLPNDAQTARPEDRASNDAGNGSDRPTRSENADGKSVLLVEDEPMISMMLADMLAENGHRVDGPHSQLQEALEAAINNNLKAGILDINLRGNYVFPIADVLIERKIPFVFLTGYSDDAVASRYNHVPILQKPVEPENIWAALRDTSKGLSL